MTYLAEAKEILIKILKEFREDILKSKFTENSKQDSLSIEIEGNEYAILINLWESQVLETNVLGLIDLERNVNNYEKIEIDQVVKIIHALLNEKIRTHKP